MTWPRLTSGGLQKAGSGSDYWTMMRMRAGRWPIEVARQRRDEFFRDHLLLFAVVAAVYVLGGTLFVLLGGRQVRQYAIGGLAAGFFWLFRELFHFEGSDKFRNGGLAERWTSRELRRLGSEWEVFDHIPFADRPDIDHVLIGPAGVFVFETKWTSDVCDIDAGDPPWCLPGAVRVIEEHATPMRNWLRSKGVESVVPVVVVWGPRVARIDSRVRREPVALAGFQLREWLSHQPTGVLNAETVKAAADVLKRYLETCRVMPLQTRHFWQRRQAAPKSPGA